MGGWDVYNRMMWWWCHQVSMSIGSLYLWIIYELLLLLSLLSLESVMLFPAHCSLLRWSVVGCKTWKSWGKNKLYVWFIVKYMLRIDWTQFKGDLKRSGDGSLDDLNSSSQASGVKPNPPLRLLVTQRSCFYWCFRSLCMFQIWKLLWCKVFSHFSW